MLQEGGTHVRGQVRDANYFGRVGIVGVLALRSHDENGVFGLGLFKERFEGFNDEVGPFGIVAVFLINMQNYLCFVRY
jgi:hypothetical protein